MATTALEKHQLSYVALSALKPYERNPRKHPKKQLHQLKASIQKFGFNSVVVVDENYMILAGHGRYLVAKDLEIQEVPVIRIDHLTEKEKTAYVIADNKLGLNSEWDMDMLQAELKLLTDADFEIETTGYTTGEVDIIFDSFGTPAIDRADKVVEPDTSVPATSRRGDVWQLGSHRVLCGDATCPADYDQLLQGRAVRLTATDAPYNLEVGGCVSTTEKYREFKNGSGEMTSAQFTEFLGKVGQLAAQHSVDGAIGAFFMDWRHIRELMDAMREPYGELKQLCVWAKPQAGMGTFYRQQHELILIFKKGDAPNVNNFELGQNGRYRSNLWQYPNPNRSGKNQDPAIAGHPTPKPVALVADCIRDLSHHGEVILDPFLGSGTTIIAAERTGRHAYGLEIDPLYVDALVRRWQNFTGLKGTLQATGQTFDEVVAERTAQNGGGHE